MIRHLFGSRGIALALLALISVGSWPVAAEAAVLCFWNETASPIKVQGMAIINGIARRGKVHSLGPGEVSQEPILVPGAILVTVVDAKQPSHVLYSRTVQFTGADLFYAIQTEEPVKDGDDASLKSRARKTAMPKVKLVPFKPTPQRTVPPSKPHR